MTLTEVKARRDVIVARELAIISELAEMKRAWIVDKVEGDFGLRTTLEAETARLAVEKNALNVMIFNAKKAERQYHSALASAILIRLVTDRGMPELVVEANRLAVDAALGSTA